MMGRQVAEWARPRVPLLAGIGLGAVLLVSVALRASAAGLIDAPQVLCDEFIHAEVARGVWEDLRYEFRGSAATPYSAIYSVLIAPAYAAGGMIATFAAIKVINALLASLVAIPAFFWTRRIVGPAWGLLAAALVLCVPGLAYAGLIMTESAFLPAFLAACWAIALAIERPTLARQGVALALVAFATGVRVQGLLVAGVLVTAVLLAAALNAQTGTAGSWARRAGADLVRWWPTAALLAGALLVTIVARAAQEGGVAGALGPYAEVSDGRYTVGGVWQHIRLHLAVLPLSVALVPVSAFLVLLARAMVPGNASTAPERAFLATAAAAIPWFVVSSAAFASYFTTGRVMERYTFYLGPLLLIALVIWLGRGMPRPRVVAILMAAVPVVMLADLPLRSLATPDATINTFSMVPFWLATGAPWLGVDGVAALIAVGGGALAVVFVLAPRRVAVVVLPLAVGGFLIYSSVKVSDALQVHATANRVVPSVGEQPGWIDDTIGPAARTHFLFAAPASFDLLKERTTVLMATEFWNRSVRGVDMVNEQVCGGLPGGRYGIDPRTGALIPQPGSAPSERAPTHVVTFRDIRPVGEFLIERPPLALYRLDGAPRVGSVVEGRTDDGWMSATSALAVTSARDSGPSRVTVVLIRPGLSANVLPVANATVAVGPTTIGADGVRVRPHVTAERTITLEAGTTRLTIDAPPAPYLVTVELDRTFVPAEVGISADVRELGALVDFEVH